MIPPELLMYCLCCCVFCCFIGRCYLYNLILSAFLICRTTHCLLFSFVSLYMLFGNRELYINLRNVNGQPTLDLSLFRNVRLELAVPIRLRRRSSLLKTLETGRVERWQQGLILRRVRLGWGFRELKVGVGVGRKPTRCLRMQESNESGEERDMTAASECQSGFTGSLRVNQPRLAPYPLHHGKPVVSRCWPGESILNIAFVQYFGISTPGIRTVYVDPRND